MKPGKCTIITCALREPYLQQTVDDILMKAIGDHEVIVVLDGYIPDPPFVPRDRVRVIHHETPRGTRCSINEAIAAADGEYIFKMDAHCLLSHGFDEVLKRDHQPDWVVTLPRYSLDPVKWKLGYGPICYEYIAWPLDRKDKVGGLTPKKWLGPDGLANDLGRTNYYWMERKREDHPIDEIQSCNGACWFMTKKWFENLGGLDERFWSFHIENVEVVLKAWLSGGQLMINKHAHHGHWWKDEKKRTVPLDWTAMRRTQAYSTWYWSHDQWPKRQRPFKWLVEHFWPIPTWPTDWEEKLAALTPPEL